jgi:hypothetical protein
LLYFDGTEWVPVRGSHNSAPQALPGGGFLVVLDGTSHPRATGLPGTVFTIVVPSAAAPSTLIVQPPPVQVASNSNGAFAGVAGDLSTGSDSGSSPFKRSSQTQQAADVAALTPSQGSQATAASTVAASGGGGSSGDDADVSPDLRKLLEMLWNAVGGITRSVGWSAPPPPTGGKTPAPPKPPVPPVSAPAPAAGTEATAPQESAPAAQEPDAPGGPGSDASGWSAALVVVGGVAAARTVPDTERGKRRLPPDVER